MPTASTALTASSTFGGPIPFKPEGYRISVPVDESAQLAVDVRTQPVDGPLGNAGHDVALHPREDRAHDVEADQDAHDDNRARNREDPLRTRTHRDRTPAASRRRTRSPSGRRSAIAKDPASATSSQVATC